MAAASPARLLDVWEQGSEQPQARRAWLLLRAHDPQATDAELARLTVGEAERRVLALRAATFGQRFDAVSRCPRCDETLELDFGIDDFPSTTDGNGDTARCLAAGDVEATYRLPTLEDLAQAAHSSNAEAARRVLIERCITGLSRRDGGAVAEGPQQGEVIAAVAAAIEAADPLAAMRLQLRCPACAHEGSRAFDAAAYLWAELDAWAAGLLHDVHLLARAYGWSESEVLALSARRRREYLDRVLS